jgi:DNA-binding MarR family transcriptional regulator/N-acetylglutamate synthase-like GNAT family acetyltransferase
MSSSTEQHIADFRAFNRFYTKQIGVLNEGLLKSPWSLTEARVLLELAQRTTTSASDLAGDLGLDAGYLSRILRKFKKLGFVNQVNSEADRRRSLLTITDQGAAAFAVLDRDSHDQIGEMIGRLNPVETDRLIGAMKTIGSILDPERSDRAPFVLRPHQPGDMGWVTHRQGYLYWQEYGWDNTFEALVGSITAKFIDDFDPAWENCWIAEQDGEIIGSVFVVKQSKKIAKLRLLYVEPKARGLGLGRSLVEECIRFARGKGYETLTLWTNDCLDAALQIYVTRGFKLTAEEKHHSFGADLVGQNWDLAL